MSEVNHIPYDEKKFEFPLQETSPINIPKLKITTQDDASPCLPKTPPPTPEVSSSEPAAPITKHAAPTPPSYLTAEFIQTALRNKYPDIVVNDLKLVPAVGAGENYVTIVFRANVTTNQGPFALICKCIPETEFRAKIANENGLTQREMDFYNNILPIFEEYLKGDENHPSRPNAPLCYHTMKEGLVDVLVLQDQVPLGYRVANRRAGLDSKQCAAALTELAKLHALSIKLRIDNPENFKHEIANKFQEQMYCERNREIFGKFIDTAIVNIAKGIRDYFPYRYHSLTSTMEGTVDYLFDKIIQLLQVDLDKLDDKIVVLNHGDFWCNNMLFQYESLESNIPTKCCMIDFQISRCASPCIDLLYFFYSSTTKQTRDQHFENLLQLYFDQVYLALENLNIQRPLPKNMFYNSIQEIKEDMKNNLIFGFMTACTITPIVVASTEDAPDLEHMTEENIDENMSEFTKVYNSRIFKSRFRGILDDFDDLGFFVEQQKIIDEKKGHENIENGEGDEI